MGIISINYRAFVHATEDEEKVLSALKFASGLEEFEKNVVAGHHGNKIIVLDGVLKDKKAVKAFFRSLSKEGLQEMIDTLDNRLDDDCFLFARLDKQEAFLGKMVLTKNDDAIALRAKVQSYPKKRELAFIAAKEYLEKILQDKD
jgi:RNA binding exosome subunit